jgi:alpha-L-glutamate ligase-like protein
MIKLWRIAKKLRERGILGINGRNANYISRYNQRKDFPKADSKLISKALAIKGNLPVPKLYGVISKAQEVSRIYELAKEYGDVVVKPERGSGGEGILLLRYNADGELETPSGAVIDREVLRLHINDICSGLFSLGGQPDQVVLEYKVLFDNVFDHVTYKGVPDIRVICLKGVPVFAMLRLPTKQSGGKANLHQGAIGVGVDLATGITQDGVSKTSRVTTHPDTGQALSGIQIPQWQEILRIASKAYDLFSLGYMGIDLVLDKNLGPLILEVNVRPGLSIQLANNRGILPRLKFVEAALKGGDLPLEERLLLVPKVSSL